jgi:hypothetical protein
MSARARTRKRGSQLLGAALALAAVVTLTTRVDTSDENTSQGGLQATTTKKSETLHERRCHAENSAAAGLAAAGLVSRRDEHSTSPHARSSSCGRRGRRGPRPRKRRHFPSSRLPRSRRTCISQLLVLRHFSPTPAHSRKKETQRRAAVPLSPHAQGSFKLFPAPPAISCIRYG